MSKQLFINNANAVPADSGTVNDPTEVAEGRIAAFDVDDFASGSLDLTSAATAERIIFVQGSKSGEDPIISPIFNVADIKAGQVFSKAYAAPVAQVSTVTAETGTGYATVRVVKVSDGFQPHERITAEVKLDGETAADIATELANLINGHDVDWVTASTSTADLILTASAGVSFETSTDGEASGWTVAATTTPNFGTGTSAHVKEIEEVAFGAQFYNRIYLPITPPSYVVDGETYDLFFINVPTNTTPNIAKSNKYHQLILAVQATASGIDLETFFGV